VRVRLAALLIVTALAYQPIWHAEWVYEDSNAVHGNPAVTAQGATIAVDRARWLSALSHRLVWQVSHDAPAHHLVNLGLHLVNGTLVSIIAATWLSPMGALLTAAVFLLHPIQTEAVAYVASRSELLATCFALLAFWRSLSAVRWYQHLTVWGCVFLAVCAKESAAAIVPLIALADVFRGKVLSRWWYAALLAPVLAMTYSVLQFDYLSRSELNQLDYAATQAYALWRYVGLIVLPIGQTVDHDFDLVPWLLRYGALYLTVAVAALIILASGWGADSETRQIGRFWDRLPGLRVALFGLTWLFVSLAPRFVMRIPEHLSEHQLYLAVVGVSLVLASGWSLKESSSGAQESC
jgi:uncharacterized membrane protein